MDVFHFFNTSMFHTSCLRGSGSWCCTGLAVRHVGTPSCSTRHWHGTSLPSRSVLVHKTGHVYLLCGALRVGGDLLYQVVHGDGPISLVSEQHLVNGGFREAWQFINREGCCIPIHIVDAVVEIDQLWHNLGDIERGKEQESSFRLENTGSVPVVVDKPSVSCSCTVPSLLEKTELSPGKVLDLTVLTKPPDSPSLRKPVLFTFYEKGTGASRRAQIEILGTLRLPMEVTPNRVDFGQVVPGAPSQRMVRFVELPTARFVLKGVDVGTLPSTHAIEEVQHSNGLRAYRLKLTLLAGEGEAAGTQISELVVTLDGVAKKKVSIPVRYSIGAPIKAVPAALAFGTAEVGKVYEARAKIVSSAHDDIRILECDASDGCLARVNRDGREPEVVVEAQLARPGVWQGVVRVKVRTSSTKDQWVEIPCAAFGRESP